jgi:hypothetical protein
VSTRPSESATTLFGASPWLFGPGIDFCAFVLPALLALALTLLPFSDTPTWAFVLFVIGVDVAHVWSTLFRVYFDRAELRSRPRLYLGLPLLIYLPAVVLHFVSPLVFWRVLAYAAAFHFVRQQYGWVVLHQRRTAHISRFDIILDRIAIYSATLFPLVYWHTHPRPFSWFVAGDFVFARGASFVDALFPIYWLVLATFVLRQLWVWIVLGTPQYGKALIVLTTWACWYIGIVALDGDFSFTVTNVLIHGIPYMILTYRYGRSRASAPDAGSAMHRALQGGAFGFITFIVALALFEEAIWDRLVWHEHPSLFGTGIELNDIALAWLVPLLALPQAVHYVLDGFVWRLRENPILARVVAHRDHQGMSS